MAHGMQLLALQRDHLGPIEMDVGNRGELHSCQPAQRFAFGRLQFDMNRLVCRAYESSATDTVAKCLLGCIASCSHSNCWARPARRGGPTLATSTWLLGGSWRSVGRGYGSSAIAAPSFSCGYS